MGQGAVFWYRYLGIIPPYHYAESRTPVPAVWDQPFQEHLSEFFGHIVWMMTIELVRQHLSIAIN